jgi:HlyD family secretion protein
MNKKILALSLIPILALLTGAVGWWQFETFTSPKERPLEATGVIEARTVSLAAQVSGQVVEVSVEEGQRVTAGQTLVRLDDSLLAPQRRQAQAMLQAAQAQLALLQAGAKAEYIAAAEAQLAQTEASLRLVEAQLALLRAGATAEQITAAEAQLAQAGAGIHIAQANFETLTAGTPPEAIEVIHSSLRLAWDRYSSLRVLFTTSQLEALRVAQATARNNREAAQAHYDDLAADTRNPDMVLNAFAGAVADATDAMAAAEAAYAAAQDSTLPYVRQIELVRWSWELTRSNVTMAQARTDGLTSDQRATSDALDAARDTLADARELETAARTAFDELAAGTAASQLTAAWSEVQRLQTQLDSYTVAALAGSGSGSLQVLLSQKDQATAQRDLATANLAGVVSGARAEEVAAAQAMVDGAAAQRDMAAANLAGLVNGARPEEIAAAQAQVDAAQAQLDTLDAQLEKFTVTGPWDGILLNRSAEIGQTTLPGATLLEIGRLDLLELTVYLAGDRFGLVTPGQTASVRVDAYPGRVFTGTVLRVADEAEFTPSNIQTKDDRVRLVYAVVISLENPALELKPGMIADAEFGP